MALTETLARVTPENAVTAYLQAYVAMTRGDAASALARLRDGNRAATLDVYAREWFRAVVAAGEAIRADPLSARAWAFGSLVPTHVLGAIGRTCRWLADGPSGDAARAECAAAGRRIDRDGRTILESFLGLSIQRVALVGLDGKAARRARFRQRCRQRRLAGLMTLVRRIIDTPSYFETAITRGEETAALDAVCARRPASRHCSRRPAG